MNKFMRRAGEVRITNAVERRISLLEEWKKDRKLSSRLRFEQSVRLLVKSIPKEWQDSEFVDELYRTCLNLLECRGVVFSRRA